MWIGQVLTNHCLRGLNIASNYLLFLHALFVVSVASLSRRVVLSAASNDFQHTCSLVNFPTSSECKRMLLDPPRLDHVFCYIGLA